MKHNKTMYYFIVWNFVPVQKGNPFLLTTVQVLPHVNMESRCPCEWGLGKCAKFVFMLKKISLFMRGCICGMWQDYGLIHSPKKKY